MFESDDELSFEDVGVEIALACEQLWLGHRTRARGVIRELADKDAEFALQIAVSVLAELARKDQDRLFFALDLDADSIAEGAAAAMAMVK